MGSGGLCGARLGPGVTPPAGVRGLRPLKLKAFFFLNLRYKKKIFLALYPVSNSDSQNILYCTLGSLPEEQTRLRQRPIFKDSILVTKATKVARIITFLSGHMCLYTWAGAVVSNSLTTASRREKQIWSLQFPRKQNVQDQ